MTGSCFTHFQYKSVDTGLTQESTADFCFRPQLSAVLLVLCRDQPSKRNCLVGCQPSLYVFLFSALLICSPQSLCLLPQVESQCVVVGSNTQCVLQIFALLDNHLLPAGHVVSLSVCLSVHVLWATPHSVYLDLCLVS